MYRFTKHRRICIFWHASLIVHLQLVYLHAFAILIYGYTINYKHVCLCIHSQLLSCCHFTEFCHLWGSSLTSWWSFGLPSGWGLQSYLIILRHLFYKLLSTFGTFWLFRIFQVFIWVLGSFFLQIWIACQDNLSKSFQRKQIWQRKLNKTASK